MFDRMLALLHHGVPLIARRALTHPSGGVISALLTDKYALYFRHDSNIEEGSDNRVTQIILLTKEVI